MSFPDLVDIFCSFPDIVVACHTGKVDIFLIYLTIFLKRLTTHFCIKHAGICYRENALQTKFTVHGQIAVEVAKICEK